MNTTPAKLKVSDLAIGQIRESTFTPNPVKDSAFPFRATHLDGKRSPKVVLSDDLRIRPGVPCQVRIVAIRKADRDDRGAIEVEYVRGAALELKEVYLEPVLARKLQVLLESGLNILLDGPQGCGKTVLARSIAQALGMRFVFFNCGAVIESTDFLATMQVQASEDGHPVTTFVKTDLLRGLEQALTEPRKRFLVFLDELNRAQESARNALMPALDTTRRIFNPVNGDFLEIPDNIQFIAAVNRGGSFTATYGIDAAQLDRFAPLQMDYLPPEEEIKLLRRRHPDLPVELVKTLVKIANTLRKSEMLESGLSVRATEEACIYLNHPLFADKANESLTDILQSAFCARYNGRWTDPQSDAGIAWGLIQKTLRAGHKEKK